MKWQSIETAPRDGVVILAWDGTSTECVFFDDEIKGWVASWGCNPSYGALSKPTHWMPLPKPPTK